MATWIDDELFKAMLRGDQGALERLWPALLRKARRIAAGLMGGDGCLVNGSTADEIAGEAVIKFENAVRARGWVNTSPTGYLARITVKPGQGPLQGSGRAPGNPDR